MKKFILLTISLSFTVLTNFSINAETKKEIRFGQIKNKISEGATGKTIIKNEELCEEVYSRVIENSSDPYLFSGNFDGDELPENLTPLKKGKNSWKIENGALLTNGIKDNGGSAGERRLVFGELDEAGNINPDAWSDYTLTTTANLKTVDGKYGNGYGVYYRADGKDNITGYIFQYDPGLGNKFVVRKVTNGKEASPFEVIKMSEIFPDGFQIADKDHEIKINVVGDQHIIEVDDVEVFNFEDNWRDKGCGGLRAWSKSTVEFSNIDVDTN
jgi:hypothetical protein